MAQQYNEYYKPQENFAPFRSFDEISADAELGGDGAAALRRYYYYHYYYYYYYYYYHHYYYYYYYYKRFQARSNSNQESRCPIAHPLDPRAVSWRLPDRRIIHVVSCR